MLAVIAHAIVDQAERVSARVLTTAAAAHRRVERAGQIVRAAVDFLSGWDVGDVLEGPIGIEHPDQRTKTSSNASPGATPADPPLDGFRTSSPAEGSSEPGTSSRIVTPLLCEVCGGASNRGHEYVCPRRTWGN